MLEILTEQQLEFILSCNKLSDLRLRANEQQYKQLIALVAARAKRQIHNGISQAILSALTDAPAYPLSTWSLVLELITIGLLPLTAISAVIAGIALIAGGIYIYSNYKDIRKQARRAEKDAILVLLKLAAIDELIQREQKTHPKCAHTIAHHSYVPLPEKKKSILPHLKQGIGTAIFTAAILFDSYYLTAYAIIAGLGFATVAAPMVGVTGLCIAAAVILTVGILVGVKQYLHSRQQEKYKQQDKALQNELFDKAQLYQELRSENAVQQKPQAKIKIVHAPKPFVIKRSVRFAQSSQIFFNRNILSRQSHHPKLVKQPIQPEVRMRRS